MIFQGGVFVSVIDRRSSIRMDNTHQSSRSEKRTQQVSSKFRNRISDPIIKSPSFSVEEIPPQHRKIREITKISRDWKMQAAQYFNFNPSEIQEKKLTDSMIVADKLSTSITPDSRVLTCKYNENLEAIALITDKEDGWELELLATNPKNIMDLEDSVKGSGTAIIRFLFHKCIRENKEYIRLYSRRSSIGFYEKMHFTAIGDPSAIIDETQNVPMYISAEKIRQLIS